MAVRDLQKKLLGGQDGTKATEELMDYIQTTNETVTSEIVTLRTQLAHEREQTKAMAEQLEGEKSTAKELRTSTKQLEDVVKETVIQYETVKGMNRVLEESRAGSDSSESQGADSAVAKQLLTQISDLKLEMGNQSVRLGELRSENLLLKQNAEQTEKARSQQ